MTDTKYPSIITSTTKHAFITSSDDDHLEFSVRDDGDVSIELTLDGSAAKIYRASFQKVNLAELCAWLLAQHHQKEKVEHGKKSDASALLSPDELVAVRRFLHDVETEEIEPARVINVAAMGHDSPELGSAFVKMARGVIPRPGTPGGRTFDPSEEADTTVGKLVVRCEGNSWLVELGNLELQCGARPEWAYNYSTGFQTAVSMMDHRERNMEALDARLGDGSYRFTVSKEHFPEGGANIVGIWVSHAGASKFVTFSTPVDGETGTEYTVVAEFSARRTVPGDLVHARSEA